MPEVRNEYPFQISYRDDRIPGSLIVLRGETAEELGQEFVQANATFDAIFAVHEKAAEEVEAAIKVIEAAANVTPIQPSPNPSGPLCAYQPEGKPACGLRMEWRTGTKEGVPWAGWFCPSRERAHKPIWVPVKKE